MNIINDIQTLLGITKMEITAVFVIFCFFLFGVFLDNLNYNQKELKTHLIFKKLDSLALANQSTFIGNDNFGNSYPPIAEKDTIVEKEHDFTPKNQNNEVLLSGKKININSASKIELMKLPGVGEKTAIKIIEYREQNKFQIIEDIMNVKGIGIKKFEKLKDYIDVK